MRKNVEIKDASSQEILIKNYKLNCDYYPPIMFTPDNYQKAINADGDDIKDIVKEAIQKLKISLEEDYNTAILIVFNDLDEELILDSSYFESGEDLVETNKFPSKASVHDQSYVSAGCFIGRSKKPSFYGVQGAFSLRSNCSQKKFSFGFDSPLSSLYVDNNCYCCIDGSAEDACEQADNKNKLKWNDSNDVYGMEIKCNSAKCSFAYYIVRIFKV